LRKDRCVVAGVSDQGSLERIAYEAALHALSEQEGALRDLRARAGSLLTAASLTVSFLGAQALQEGLDVVAWVAIAAFAVTLLGTLYVLLPKDGLIFALDGPELYVNLWEARDSEAELHRALAYWVSTFRSDNKSTLDRLYWSFKAATVALILQVLLWASELSSIV
jgi:hypothetical protein